MNELQKKEYDILTVFIEVCEKLHLQYYLVCGSALGAVKYRGFIPWDDDVDVAMPRKDYERFLQESSELLPTHLFLQNFHTDPAFPQIYSKLRDSNTTYIEKSARKLPIHHGIYIDIFPLDGYPGDQGQQTALERKKRTFKRKLACAYDVERKGLSLLLCHWYRLCGCHRRTAKIAAEYERLITRWQPDGSEILCNHGNWQGVLDYTPRSMYGNGAEATFEGRTVLVPTDYDAYLRRKYGDYRKDLPREEQQGHHYYEVCDPNKPYTAYK